MRSRTLAVRSLGVVCTMLACSAAALPAKPIHAEPAPSSAMPSGLEAVVEAYGHQLAGISSDTTALLLYEKHLAPALGIQDTIPLVRMTSPSRSRSSGMPPPNLRVPALQLTSELAAWQFSGSLRRAAEARDLPALREFLNAVASRDAWLLGHPERHSLARAVSVARVLLAFATSQRAQRAPPPDYDQLANYLDRSYPQLTGPESWVDVAEQGGVEPVRRRLVEFWEQAPGDASSQKEAMSLYFDTRLRPVFSAQIAALSIRAEADARARARTPWSQLRSWREEWSTQEGRYRLCGTWLWTVHNHQNHQDHKMMMTFPPPNESHYPGPVPSKVIVLGDVVYLRWEFQDGYQEDSLLFAGKGQRLEGTFMNSRGPWGSITGKRTAPCAK